MKNILGKKVIIEFCKSSGCGSGSRNILNEFLPLWRRGNSTNFADNSRSCRRILRKFLVGTNRSSLLTIEITIQMQEFLTECLPLRDGDNFTTLAGSAVLVEVCGLRVILQCFNLVFNQLGRTGPQSSSRRRRFRIDTRSIAWELILFCPFEPATVKPN